MPHSKMKIILKMTQSQIIQDPIVHKKKEKNVNSQMSCAFSFFSRMFPVPKQGAHVNIVILVLFL